MLRASARETSIDRKCRFPLRGTERSHMSMVPPPPTWGRVGVGEARDDCRPPRRGFPLPDLPHAGGGGFNACSPHVCLPCAPSDSSVSSASVAWANAPPARISAATQIASMISAGVAPSRVAALVWPWMQYGHWVTCATATAISCLVLRGSAPSRNTASLNLWKAASASGASAARFSASARLGFGYIESVMARPFFEAPVRPEQISRRYAPASPPGKARGQRRWSSCPRGRDRRIAPPHAHARADRRSWVHGSCSWLSPLQWRLSRHHRPGATASAAARLAAPAVGRRRARLLLAKSQLMRCLITVSA